MVKSVIFMLCNKFNFEYFNLGTPVKAHIYKMKNFNENDQGAPTQDTPSYQFRRISTLVHFGQVLRTFTEVCGMYFSLPPVPFIFYSSGHVTFGVFHTGAERARPFPRKADGWTVLHATLLPSGRLQKRRGLRLKPPVQ
jgi:hypothetical protein